MCRIGCKALLILEGLVVENFIGFLRLVPIRIFIALREFFRPLAAQFRLHKREEYGHFYDSIAKQFPVGCLVRTKQYDEDMPVILLSPSVQELGFLTTGQADERGYKQMRDAGSSERSLADSLYEKHEIWVVVRFNESREEFIERLVYFGVESSLQGEGIPVLVKPSEEVYIAWPYDYGYGKNIVLTDSSIIEKVE